MSDTPARHRYDEDSAVQNWGRNLPAVAEMLAEFAAKLAELARQATEHVTDPVLRDAIIDAADLAAKAAREAEGWWAAFQAGNARDLEREQNPRNGHGAEVRADVGYAMRDV